MNNDDIRKATGSSYCLGYPQLIQDSDLVQVTRFCDAAREKFRPIAKTNFTPETNSRWLLRHYLAIKFATAAALMAGSADYAQRHNLLMGVPYFNYYAVLSACRAFLFTSPHVEWEGENTVVMTHEKILNLTSDLMRPLDPQRRESWRGQMAGLRSMRELYSYRFPLSGPRLLRDEAFDPGPATELARLIAELASLNSECFDAMLSKYAPAEIAAVDLPEHEWAEVYKLVGEDVYDPADGERFYKLRTRWGRVSSLESMVSDGLYDDLYGSWHNDVEDPNVKPFAPDDYSRLILAL